MSPRVQEDSLHPRLQSGSCARPRSFTVLDVIGMNAVVFGVIQAPVLFAIARPLWPFLRENMPYLSAKRRHSSAPQSLCWFSYLSFCTF